MSGFRKRVLFRPRNHDSTFIYLHGFGDSAETYSGGRRSKRHYFMQSKKKRFPRLRVVLLSARCRTMTYEEGSSSSRKQRSSWFDYVTNHQGKREDTIQGIAEANAFVHKVVREEADLFLSPGKRRFDRVFLGGVSQGCSMAFHSFATFPRSLGGFCGIFGHVLSITPIAQLEPPSDAGEKKHWHNVYFFNSTKDSVVRWEWAGPKIQAVPGARVVLQNNLSHNLGMAEWKFIKLFLREVL